jgi:hypothetical protein
MLVMTLNPEQKKKGVRSFSGIECACDGYLIELHDWSLATSLS